jgi:hypothetical protein
MMTEAYLYLYGQILKGKLSKGYVFSEDLCKACWADATTAVAVMEGVSGKEAKEPERKGK